MYKIRPVAHDTFLADASSVSYGVDGPGFESRKEQDIFSKTVQTGDRAHPASYSMGTNVICRRKGGRSMKLNVHPV